MGDSLLSLLERTRRIGSWTVDTAESVCHWSKETYDIHEEDPTKPISLEDGIKYYVPEHQAEIQSCVERAIAYREPWDVELRIRTAKGNVRWVRAIGEPIFRDGEVVRLQGLFEDIHSRKSLEQDRERSLKRLLAAERVAKLGHFHWSEEPGHELWSPGLRRLLGMADEGPLPPLAQRLARVHPDDAEHVSAAARLAYSEKRSFSSEFRVVVGDSVRHLKVEALPNLAEDGTIASVEGVVIDQTDQVGARKRIENLNRRLTLALEASQIGVWEWDVVNGGLIWDAQMYQLYGVRDSDFEGAYVAWEKGLHPEDRARATQEVQEAVEHGKKFDTAFRVVWPGKGEVRTLRAKADLQRDEHGQPHRMIGVNWDITEAQNIEAKLRRSNEELTQFAYRASHDLKAPLTTIKRLAHFLAMDVKAGETREALKNVKTIESRAASLEQLVLGLLDVARADLKEEACAPVDVSALLADANEALQGLCEEFDVSIESLVELEGTPLLPVARTQQVVTNLLANAIKYADPKKDKRWARVHVAAGEGGIVIHVHDNGIGIPEEHQARAFDLFTSFQSSEGSGVGLYIVLKNVERMGGSITLDSSPQGTTFRVELPCEIQR